MRRFTDALALLHDLLDRAETHADVQRVLAHVDYPGFASTADQDRFFDLLRAAERAGGIALDETRRRGVLRVDRVRLCNAVSLYQHLGREPAADCAAASLAPLLERVGPRLLPVLEEVRDAWARRASWCGLGPGEARALGQAADLATALAARAVSSAPDCDYRSFASEAVGDSKALGILAAPVARLLRRLLPVLPGADLDPEALFATLGIVRLPQPLLVSGPLALRGHPLPRVPYWGLPPEEAITLRTAAPVKYVLSVENFTSFVRHAREINHNNRGLVLYTNGFPARASLDAIVAIAGDAGAPTYHWGDIDPGGLRIFRHIEQALSAAGVILRPHLMNEALLVSYGTPAQRQSRPLIQSGARGSAVEALWSQIAQGGNNGLTLEQEALAPCAPDHRLDVLGHNNTR